ncbi:MAG: hypothetical protein U1G07_13020 [Verrucomicrobiota bacterium]
MNLIQRSLDLNNSGRALDLLNRHRPQANRPDLRNWEWRYLWQQCRSDALFVLRPAGDWVGHTVVSPDGKWLAVAERSAGAVALWDLRTRREVNRLRCGNQIVSLTFAPTNGTLAVAAWGEPQTDGSRASIQLWNVDSAQLVRRLPLTAPGIALRFSGDGARLLSVDQGALTWWDTKAGTRTSTLPLPASGRVQALSCNRKP